MLWQQRRLVGLSAPVVRRAPRTVGEHRLLGVLNGLVERDGEGQGEAGEADGETGAAGDVEVGKLAEGVLEFEHADELRVQGEDARATGCHGGCGVRSDWARVGDVLRTRPRMLSRPESTESMPSALSLRDGFRSLMASGR